MYEVESKGGAIVCMLVALMFLGTWPAILNYLERRGRLPQHTFLDYSITNLLAAVAIALTAGQIGEPKHNSPNFISQLQQIWTSKRALGALFDAVLGLTRLVKFFDGQNYPSIRVPRVGVRIGGQIDYNWPCVLLAMVGGVFLSLGNLSMQYALAIVGLSVTEVITSSIAVVLGTTLNYFLDDRINKAEILFPGVGCFLIAVCLGSFVHTSNSKDNAAKLRVLSKEGGSAIEMPSSTGKHLPNDVEKGSSQGNKAEFGSANFLVELENKRAIKIFGKSIWLGILITFFGGGCYAIFSPAINLATNDQWNLIKNDAPHLVVYTAFFYFSLSFFIIAVALNVIFLYRPVLNLPKSSLKAYLNDWDGRQWAFLAGIVCGLGNGLQFAGGQAAGYAAADCVQALPLVSTFWGILIFGEYRKASKRTYALLISMLLMFIVAVAVLIASSGHRKTK